MVQCHGVGQEEGWGLTILTPLPLPKCMHEKGLLPSAQDPGGIGEFGRCWTFFLSGPQVGVLANKMEEALKQYTTFTVGNLGSFECDHMPFELCNVPATFQRLMQNCLGKLNLIYCIIYLDDINVFLQTAEEHLHRLHMVFN